MRGKEHIPGHFFVTWIVLVTASSGFSLLAPALLLVQSAHLCALSFTDTEATSGEGASQGSEYFPLALLPPQTAPSVPWET